MLRKGDGVRVHGLRRRLSAIGVGEDGRVGLLENVTEVLDAMVLGPEVILGKWERRGRMVEEGLESTTWPIAQVAQLGFSRECARWATRTRPHPPEVRSLWALSLSRRAQGTREVDWTLVRGRSVRSPSRRRRKWFEVKEQA
jgi:hypothetical protein